MSRKIDPKVPKYMKNDTALVTAKVRLRKRPIGTIGSLARSSHATKAASRTAPPASDDDDQRVRPALGLTADEAEDEREEADRGQAEAGQVERARRAVALAAAPARRRAAGPGRWGR